MKWTTNKNKKVKKIREKTEERSGVGGVGVG